MRRKRRSRRCDEHGAVCSDGAERVSSWTRTVRQRPDKTRLRPGSDCSITTISGQQPFLRVSAPLPASLVLLTHPAPTLPARRSACSTRVVALPCCPRSDGPFRRARARESARPALRVCQCTRIQRETTAEWACTELWAELERGMRLWWCGSEDDRHEDSKPQYGDNDRHEPQAEIDQNRVSARGLRVSGGTAQEQPNDGEEQRGPRVGQPGAPRTHAAFSFGPAALCASRVSKRAGRNSVTSASTACTPW
jgi:hypothetical protein